MKNKYNMNFNEFSFIWTGPTDNTFLSYIEVNNSLLILISYNTNY